MSKEHLSIIAKYVSQITCVEVIDIKSKSREQNKVFARMLLSYIANKDYKINQSDIATYLGIEQPGVTHHIATMETELKQNRLILSRYQRIIYLLSENLKTGARKSVQHESIIQQQALKWFKLQYPQTLIFSTANEGKRTTANGKRMVANGLKKGVADIQIIPKNRMPIFVEFKFGNNKQTEHQKAFEKEAVESGCSYHLCYSVEQFIKTINDELKKF